MWRSYHIRVYLFSYCFLIHQIASRNGFAIPLSRPISASMPWKLTNSSSSSMKHQPKVSTTPYPNFGSTSGISNVKTDKYATDEKKYVTGSTNYKTVRLDSTEPKSVNSRTRNTLPLSNAAVSCASLTSTKPIQSKLPVGSSYTENKIKNHSSGPSLTKKIAFPYDPKLARRFNSSSPLIKNIPSSYCRPVAFCGKREQELSWNNNLDTKDKSQSIRMKTLSKPVVNSFRNPKAYAPFETMNYFTGPKLNDMSFRPPPPQVSPSSFSLSPYSQYKSPLNCLADSLAPLQFENSALNAATLGLNVNLPFTSNNIETSCNPYSPAVNLQCLTETDDLVQTVSSLTPISYDVSCQNNDFINERPTFKVKSMELKILPMPFLTDNPIQGMVKPLLKNKTVPCFSVCDNNSEVNSQTLTDPIIKLVDQPPLDAFETPTFSNEVLNDVYLSDSMDPNLSLCNADSQVTSPNSSFPILSSPVVLNKSSTASLIDTDQSILPSPILDISEAETLENSSFPFLETALPQIVCANESTNISSVQSEEYGITPKASSELQREIDPECISDIPIGPTCFPMNLTDSDLLIENSNITILPECNVSISETTVDDLSSSELPLLEKEQPTNTDCNILEQESLNLLPSCEEQSSLAPKQESDSEMYISPDNLPQVVELTSEQNVPRSEILEDAPLTIFDVFMPNNPSLSEHLNKSCSLYPSNYDINYFYIDSPIEQDSTNSLVSFFQLPNEFLYETIDILPFEQTFIHNNISLTDIPNVSLPTAFSANTVFSDVDVILLPYIEYQSYLDDNLKTDEIPSTFLVPYTIIDSTYIPNNSSPSISYDIMPYIDCDESFVPNILTPVPYLLDHQPNSPDDIIEPIYFVQEDSCDYVCSSIVFLPDSLDSFSSFSTIFGGDNFDDSVPRQDIVNNFSEVELTEDEVINNKTFISEINSMVEASPVIDYAVLSSASDESPDVSILNDKLANTLSNEKMPSVEKNTAVSLPCVQPDSGNKCNRKSKPAKAEVQNTKRHSRKTSSKSNSDVSSESTTENITGEDKLPNSESFVTVSDMPYFVSILQHSLDGLSSMEYDDCGLYNTVNLGSTTPLPGVIESKPIFGLMSPNHYENSNFALDNIKSSLSLDNVIFDNDFRDVEEIAQYIVLKELLNSDCTSNWDLLGKIIDLLCSDKH